MTSPRLGTGFVATIETMLEGSDRAFAQMPWGNPGPVNLPSPGPDRTTLIMAHAVEGPAIVTYAPANKPPGPMRVDDLQLAAICPDADGFVRWVGIDFDGHDHGDCGLIDPMHAVRCLASAADDAGLFGGLLVARSRGGVGRHVFLLVPHPVSLADAVVGVSALCGAAFRLAARDVDEYECPHAFRTGAGPAVLGQSGTVELIPRSTTRPALGWALHLPRPSRIIDPFSGEPMIVEDVPAADDAAWRQFVAEARIRQRAMQRHRKRKFHPGRTSNGTERISERTRAFLDGMIPPGSRNTEAFAAACDLLRRGASAAETERMILSGAGKCGLPEREARDCVVSAIGISKQQRRRP